MRLVADHRILLIGDQLERAGADRLQIELLGRPGVQRLLGILGRLDRGEVHRHGGDERRLRPLQDELDGMVVDLLDRLQQIGHADADEVLVGAAGHAVERMVGLPLALEAEHHVVGVEVARRGEALGGLELDALAQVEGVLQPVVRDRPALGQRRLQVGGAALELDQAVVDLARAGVERGAGGVERRAEALRAALGAVDQRLGLDLRRQGGGERQPQAPDDETITHRCHSLCKACSGMATRAWPLGRY